MSVAELKANASKLHGKPRGAPTSQAPISAAPASTGTPFSPSTSTPSPGPVFHQNIRKDSSPVKPLSSILNIPRLLSKPHTAAEISALWTAYHASRSGGTGKGYICASVPLDLYHKMRTVSVKYSMFVVPIPRIQSDQGEGKNAYEFYFLQWDLHGTPPAPSTTEDPFSTPTISSNSSQVSTILFTPLQEYKMRASFAIPYLVLTFYTDLASSHRTVLMRGEITPAAAGTTVGASNVIGSEGKHLLSQEDAQLLAMQVQRFYLWGEDRNKEKGTEGERLLKAFHEKPEEFKWEDLLKYAG